VLIIDEDQAVVHKHEIDTPALLLDLDVVERNSQRMSDYFADRAVALRPHVKLHRATPELAHMQIDAGAIGLTCAKLSEAEVLVASGVTDILIANQIVGPAKISRLVELAHHSNIKVAVDSSENVAALSQAAEHNDVTLGILVEVNIGHNRCGVAPFGPALALAKEVVRSPGLKFYGLMGYDGHCTLKVSESERGPLSKKANTLLVETRDFVQEAGIGVEIVSGSGTFTYRFAAEVEGITEIQAGTYLLMDTTFRDNGVREFDPALSVLATVISQPDYPGANGMIVADVGRKSISPLLGMPEIKVPADARLLALSDEHARILPGDEPLQIGDKVEIWVRDANATINQFDRFYALRGDVLEAIWPIPSCGNST
jgi:D-serine deaminase-like pyridoxal phosphate-dependent protein